MRASGQKTTRITTDARNAHSDKGKKRIVEIMEACKIVLIDKGYTQFSLRNIAREAGIHLSNLQYYFRTREELIKGLIDYNSKSYLEKILGTVCNTADETAAKVPGDGRLPH